MSQFSAHSNRHILPSSLSIVTSTISGSPGIDEGDEWPEDIEQVEADRKHIDRMTEWMNKYYEAVAEMEDLFDAE